MAFEAYLVSPFSHRHENLMFDALVQSLNSSFASRAEPHYLIGNFTINNEEFDAIFLKRNAISVVEMKSYGGMVHFSEIGDWYAGEKVVLGGSKGNPFRQVRSYKFTLLNYLQRNQQRILSIPREVAWGHISGVVLFGKDIQFDEQMPAGIGAWFHICDQRTAALRLASLTSQRLQLRDDELARILRSFELGPNHRYCGRSNEVESTPAAVPTWPPVVKKVKYHKDSQFRDFLLRMRQGGGAKMQGAIRTESLFAQVGRGINAFAALPCQADPRIPASAVFAVNDHCRLVTLVAGDNIYPFFIGEPDEVEQWISGNPGLTLAVDGETKRITPTLVGTDSLQPAASTAENLPLLVRVPGVDLAELIPSALIRRHLLQLNESSTDEEIGEVLEALNEDLRGFVRDIISLTRAGDIKGAEARVRLRNGEACPASDAPGFAADAALSDANADQIVVISELDDRQLEQLFGNKDFKTWILFLHEEQKKVVEANFSKPVVLTGVSGSGKTCILVHRARHLARKYRGERIGIMTLNKALAGLLQNLVNELCGEEEAKNIKVMAFYDYFRELLHELGPGDYLEQLQDLAPGNEALKQVIEQVDRTTLANDLDTRSGETSEDTWEGFYDQHNDAVQSVVREVSTRLEAYHIDACRYLREECTLVRSALALTERIKYLDGEQFAREGRVIPFAPTVRREVLKLLLLFEEWMLHGAVLDVVELTQALTPLWKEIRDLLPAKRFRCLLVDEFQDFSTLDLRLLRRLPTEEENGLFLAGDTVQKILVKRLRLQDAALEEGSAVRVRMKKNYRNSRQILQAASKLANHYGELAGKQGEEIEVLDPELAQRQTGKPIALKTNNAIKKAWEIASECVAAGKTAPWTVCIVTAAPEAVSVKSIIDLRPKGMAAGQLNGDSINNAERLVVGTMQDVKGFEFSVVLIVGCDADLLPGAGVPAAEAWRDALRLYVAMTRSRDQVWLIYEREPSEFLKVMEPEIFSKEELVLSNYEVEPLQTSPRQLASPTTSPFSPVLPADDHDPNEICESWFSPREQTLLRRYYAQHVFREHAQVNITFREWLRPKNLKTVNFGHLAMIGRRDKLAFEAMRRTFLAKGIS